MTPVSIVLFVKNQTQDSIEYWMQVRNEEGILNGLWEFPGGKVEEGEEPVEAAVREIDEEVGVKIEKSDLTFFKALQYDYSDKRICLFCFVSEFNKIPEERGKWFEIEKDELSKKLEGKIPPINHQIIDELSGFIFNQKDLVRFKRKEL